MKMSKFLNNKLLLISVILVVVVLSIIGVSVFAIKHKSNTPDSNASTPVKLESPKIEESPKVETAPVVNSSPTPTPAPVQQPQQKPVQPAATQESTETDLDKNCVLVNDTIAHIRATFSARGSASSNADILNDLNTNPRNASAHIYYQQCVDAGKTATL